MELPELFGRVQALADAAVLGQMDQQFILDSIETFERTGGIGPGSAAKIERLITRHYDHTRRRHGRNDPTETTDAEGDTDRDVVSLSEDGTERVPAEDESEGGELGSNFDEGLDTPAD